MSVPTSEVGYTSAMPSREDHEVRQGHVGHWIKKNNFKDQSFLFIELITACSEEQSKVITTLMWFCLSLKYFP